MAPENRAILSLESGEHFFGYGFGPSHDSAGELVFNTSMTGYQEIATDASYRGQIVTLTYPLINNYGANPIDVESRRAWIAALVVREQEQDVGPGVGQRRRVRSGITAGAREEGTGQDGEGESAGHGHPGQEHRAGRVLPTEALHSERT